MTFLRDKAVQKLQVAQPRLNPVKQIAIARKYCCDELVKEPFETLVARKEVLSREEVSQLPLEDLHGLIVRREALMLRENAKLTSGQCTSCTQILEPDVIDNEQYPSFRPVPSAPTSLPRSAIQSQTPRRGLTVRGRGRGHLNSLAGYESLLLMQSLHTEET